MQWFITNMILLLIELLLLVECGYQQTKGRSPFPVLKSNQNGFSHDRHTALRETVMNVPILFLATSIEGSRQQAFRSARSKCQLEAPHARWSE